MPMAMAIHNGHRDGSGHYCEAPSQRRFLYSDQQHCRDESTKVKEAVTSSNGQFLLAKGSIIALSNCLRRLQGWKFQGILSENIPGRTTKSCTRFWSMQDRQCLITITYWLTWATPYHNSGVRQMAS